MDSEADIKKSYYKLAQQYHPDKNGGLEEKFKEVIFHTTDTKISAPFVLPMEILHIELAKWCDVFLVCPLSAHTLALLALGLCESLLSLTYRALPKGKKIFICPAMNTHMYENWRTLEHLACLKKDGCI